MSAAPSRPADRWRDASRLSAIPQSIVDARPEPEAMLEPERLRWRPEEDAAQPVRPSPRRRTAGRA